MLTLQVAEAEDRQQTLKSGRMMAVLAMFYIILITPWMLRQIIVGCTNYTVSRQPITKKYLIFLYYLKQIIWNDVTFRNVEIYLPKNHGTKKCNTIDPRLNGLPGD